jgi:ADP-heptose:LPS heptosyltransferase
MPDRILVIRLGALGDLALCIQAFHEIRQAHKDAEIALLTMPAFAGFARRMPWFDRVIVDPRPPAIRVDQWLRLVADVRAFGPKRVYDLQGKRRQSVLFALLGGPLGPEWSGAAPYCSHPRPKLPTPGTHFTDYVTAQLRLAGVKAQPPADVNWLDAPIDVFQLPERYAVLVPGCAPHREYKRWPPRNFAALAQKLETRGIASVAVGTAQDAEAIAAIRSIAPHVTDLSGRTDLFQLAGLMRRAEVVIANDTGPMHIAAALGAPTLGLMSGQVDAAWNAPHGPRAKALRGTPLAALDVDKVLLALDEFLAQKR